MEEHFVAAAAGPLVEAARRVRGERQRARRGLDAEAEQPRTGGRGGERAGDAGRPVHPGDVDVEHGPSDARAGLVAGDDRAEKVAAVGRRELGEAERDGHDDDAEMADAADVHVVAHEAVAEHGVREHGVRQRDPARVADDARRAAADLSRAVDRELDGLPGPAPLARLERAGEVVDQRELRLVDDLGRQRRAVDRCERAREPDTGGVLIDLVAHRHAPPTSPAGNSS